MQNISRHSELSEYLGIATNNLRCYLMLEIITNSRPFQLQCLFFFTVYKSKNKANIAKKRHLLFFFLFVYLSRDPWLNLLSSLDTNVEICAKLSKNIWYIRFHCKKGLNFDLDSCRHLIFKSNL